MTPLDRKKGLLVGLIATVLGAASGTLEPYPFLSRSDSREPSYPEERARPCGDRSSKRRQRRLRGQTKARARALRQWEAA